MKENFMLLRKTTLLLMLVLAIGVSGCYVTPVRHLAADVALLKVGKSTQEDALIYLGDPDEQVQLEDGVVKWIYKETKQSLAEKTPVVGKHIGSPEHLQVVVTFTNGIVSETAYYSSDEDEMDWADDYSWQKKK